MNRSFLICALTLFALSFTVGFTPISEDALRERAKPMDSFFSRTVQRINHSFELGDLEFESAKETVGEIPGKIQKDVENKVKETVQGTVNETMDKMIPRERTSPVSPMQKNK